MNSETVIPYELSRAAYVRINIYNLLGEKVTTLVNSVQERGKHSAIWNPQGLSNGIYIYEIEAGDFRDTKKLLIQK